MRKINENDYVDYTIVGNGWSVTLSKFNDALRQFDNVKHGTLYWNKQNGDRALIDSR